MRDRDDTKERLIEEVAMLRMRIAELEAAESKRKQAEDALRESEEKYRSLFEHSQDAILLTVPDGSILDANRAACEMFGRSPEDIKSFGRSGLVDMADQRLHTALSERALKGFAHAEITMLRANGDKFPAEVTSTVFVDASGRRKTSMIIRDISERKRSEEALKERDIQFEKLSLHVPGMIYQFMKRPDGTYCVPFTTESIKDIFGCSPQDVREDFSPIARVILPEDLAKLMRSIESSAEHLTAWQCEYRVQIPGRPMRWMFGQSTPEKLRGGRIIWHGFNTDITERKQAEAALQASEREKTTLNEIANVFLTIPDERIYEEVLSVVLKRMQSEYGVFGFIADNGDLVIPSMTREIWGSCQVPEKSIVFPRHTWGHSLWGRAIREQQSFLSNGPFETPEGHVTIESFLTVPIVFGAKTIGLLSVANKSGGFTQEDRIQQELIANAISPILNVRLERDRQQKERRKAEEALQESEERVRSLINSTPDIVCFKDEQGRWLEANEANLELFQLKGIDYRGKKDSELAEYSSFYRDAFLTCEDTDELAWRKGGPSRDDETFRCPDGTTKIYDVIKLPLFHSDGRRKGLIVLGRDITERKQAEEDLITANQQLNDIIEFLPDATLVIDGEGKVIAWNRAIEEMTGVSKKEMVGKGDHEYTLPFYGERRPHLLDLIGVSNEELESKYRFLQRKGHILSAETYVPSVYGGKGAYVFATGAPLLDIHGKCMGAIESIRDITGYKEAEAALQESQRQLGDIINFLPDATLVIDKDGKVLAWNRAIEAMTGVKAEEIVGKGNYEYSVPFYGERRPILIDLALHPNQETEKDYTALQRRGDIIFGEAFTPGLPPGNVHLSATASVLRDSKGEIVAAIECIRDNTERKRLEERLNRAEKMEALGTLAGGVAHDLNNVLGVLIGYSELLLEKIPKGDPLNRHVFYILQSSQRGAAIIQDLLTLARRGVAVSEVINLNDVLSDLSGTPEFNQVKEYHPKVTFRTDLEKDLLNIKGSPVHLEKTMMNLIVNAAEAITDKGAVTIRTENRYLDKPIRGYDDMQEGDYVVLTVSDNGKGIPQADLGKIFEPFYTKKVMGRSGTGLGLAVVWGTGRDHDGYIDVQSEEGKGSTLALYFPVTREELSKEKDKTSPDQYMGEGESILVVDDMEGQRELASSMLARLGYRVQTVSCGEEAVAYLKSDNVDLLVLDMIMEPGIDGLETYQRVLEINPKQRAVIVSGFSETDRVKKAQALGAGAYVKKPYVLEKLGLAVRKELNRVA